MTISLGEASGNDRSRVNILTPEGRTASNVDRTLPGILADTHGDRNWASTLRA